MKKELIKKIRDKMINDIWTQKKSEWEMKDIAYLFGISLPQIYRIIKQETKKVEKRKS